MLLNDIEDPKALSKNACCISLNVVKSKKKIFWRWNYLTWVQYFANIIRSPFLSSGPLARSWKRPLSCSWRFPEPWGLLEIGHSLRPLLWFMIHFPATFRALDRVLFKSVRPTSLFYRILISLGKIKFRRKNKVRLFLHNGRSI